MLDEFFKIGDLGDLFNSYLGSSYIAYSFYITANGTSLTGDLNSVGFAITFLGEFLFSNS